MLGPGAGAAGGRSGGPPTDGGSGATKRIIVGGGSATDGIDAALMTSSLTRLDGIVWPSRPSCSRCRGFWSSWRSRRRSRPVPRGCRSFGARSAQLLRVGRRLRGNERRIPRLKRQLAGCCSYVLLIRRMTRSARTGWPRWTGSRVRTVKFASPPRVGPLPPPPPRTRPPQVRDASWPFAPHDRDDGRQEHPRSHHDAYGGREVQVEGRAGRREDEPEERQTHNTDPGADGALAVPSKAHVPRIRRLSFALCTRVGPDRLAATGAGSRVRDLEPGREALPLAGRASE